MPISLDLANFTEAFHIRYVKTIAESFQRLGQWLTQRVKQADTLERASSRIPVVWFNNDAVTLWIDASQKDALAPAEPPPSFDAHLREGGRRFVAGLADTRTLPSESLIIPRFFDAVLAGVDEIVKSVERFHKPTKHMFDTEARTASDLFGEAVLAFRALYWSKDQLWDFWATLYILKEPPKQGASPVESVNALPDLFERVTRYVVAGLYLVPLLPQFVKRLWKETSIFIRGKVLEIFAGIEERVFGVRRQVIDAFYIHLREALAKGLGYALAWRFVSTAYVALFVELGEMWSQQLTDQFGKWFSDLSTFMNKMIDVFGWFELLLDDLLKVDLMELLVPLLKDEWWWSIAEAAADVPTLPIGDLAEEQSRAAANKRLQDWLTLIKRRVSAAAGLLGGLIGGGAASAIIESKLKPVRQILNIALGTKTADVEETAAFQTLTIPSMPDVSATFTTWLAPLRTAMGDFITSLQSQTKDLLDKGTETLDAIGTRFERAAAAALRGPSAEQYLAISDTAAKMAEKAFPASDAGGSEPDAVIGAIARSWENWFVRGEQGARAGFDVIGTIIPKYIEAMRAYWAERQARGEEATVRLPEDLPKDFPTSPHIMALRPVLARTLVPRVTIDATGHALDEELAQRVADAFLDRVQAAHREGLAKLAAIQAQAGV